MSNGLIYSIKNISLALSLISFGLLGSHCSSKKPGEIHPVDAMHFPIGLTAHPNGKYLYVVNSDFDLKYFTGAIQVIDIAREKFVGTSAVFIGQFGGQMVLDSTGEHAYLPIRGDNSLTHVNIKDDGKTLECSNPNVLELGAGAKKCSGPFVIQHATDALLASGVTLSDSGVGCSDGFTPCPNPNLFVGRDPVSVSLDDSRKLLYLVSSRDGDLSVFRLTDDGVPMLKNERLLSPGTYTSAVSPIDGSVLVASRSVAALEIDKATYNASSDALSVSNLRTIPISRDNQFPLFNFGRGITFSPDGKLAFVVSWAPARVAVIDMSLDEKAQAKGNVIGFIAVGEQPGTSMVVPTEDSYRLYVPSFIENQIYVIDPGNLSVVDVIKTGVGPFSLAYTYSPIPRLYVTLFEDAAIAVIDVDSSSNNPTYNQVIKTWTNKSLK